MPAVKGTKIGEKMPITKPGKKTVVAVTKPAGKKPTKGIVSVTMADGYNKKKLK